MSLPNDKINKDYLITLLEAKKVKQARLFLDLVSKRNPSAQEAVSKALQQCFVDKKTVPMGITSALNLYKELCIRCQLDYMEEFNQKVHRFLYDVCLFNPQEPPQERGSQYFIKTMKAERSQKMETLGITAVILSLQIIQYMAKWYPIDYFTEDKSIYVLFYQKLREKGVTFPDLKNPTFFGQNDKKKFFTNYELWRKRMDELMEDEENETPNPGQGKKDGKKQSDGGLKKHQVHHHVPGVMHSAPSKTDQSVKKSISGINSKPRDSSKQSQQDFIKSNNQLISRVEKKQDKKPNSDIKDQKKPNTQKLVEHRVQKILQTHSNHQQPTFLLGQSDKKITNPSNSNPVKTLQQKKDSPPKQDKPLKKPSPPKQQLPPPKQKPKQPQNKKQNTIVDQKQSVPKQTKLEEQNKKVQPYKNKQEPSKSIKKQQEHKNNLSLQESYQSLSKQKEHQKQFKAVVHTSEKPKTQRKQQTVQKPPQSPRFILSTDQIPHSNPKIPETPQKQKKEEQKKNQPNLIVNKRQKEKERGNQSLKKMPRTQKSKQIQQSPKQQLRKRSIPKTQKRAMHNMHSQMNFINSLNMLPPKKDQNVMGKTLSYFRQQKHRKKGDISEQLSQNYAQPILSLIEKSHLDELVVPFLPQYFDPVDRKMEALILQSLRIGQPGKQQPSRPFYQNSQLAARLIKLPSQYILTLHNIGKDPIQIGYSQKLQAKYGDQFSMLIKVCGSQRKKPQQMMYWKTLPNDFVDISFVFQTNDPNLKFLQFCLVINKKVIVFQLPITILDQGLISKSISIDYLNQFVQLYGKNIKSTPFILSPSPNSQAISELPPFFARNKNKDSKLVGHFTFSIQADPYTTTQILVLIKQSQGHPQKHQIHTIFDRRVQENEDFAKVLIELLCLLLEAPN